MMQKQRSKKLVVRREAIRQLSQAELAQAHGGESEQTCVTTHVAQSQTAVGCPPG